MEDYTPIEMSGTFAFLCLSHPKRYHHPCLFAASFSSQHVPPYLVQKHTFASSPSIVGARVQR